MDAEFNKVCKIIQDELDKDIIKKIYTNNKPKTICEKRFFLFLDHDGVTHNWKDWCNPVYKMGTVIEAITQNSCYHALNRLFVLNKIHITLIPVSSWSNVFDNFEDSSKSLLESGITNIHLLESDIKGQTELWNHSHSERVDYIKSIINKHNLKKNEYVILDDDYFDLYEADKLSYIRTDGYEGLNHKDFRKIEKIINKDKIEKIKQLLNNNGD